MFGWSWSALWDEKKIKSKVMEQWEEEVPRSDSSDEGPGAFLLCKMNILNP